MRTIGALLAAVVVVACSSPGEYTSTTYAQRRTSGIAPPSTSPYHAEWCEAARIVLDELYGGLSLDDDTARESLSAAATRLEAIPGSSGLARDVRAIAEAGQDQYDGVTNRELQAALTQSDLELLEGRRPGPITRSELIRAARSQQLADAVSRLNSIAVANDLKACV